MRRLLTRILPAVLFILLAIALGTWAWLWHSESGAEWLWKEGQARLASSPAAARLEGRLSGSLGGGLRLDGFSYHDANLTIRARQLSLAVRLNLYPVALTVRRLDLGGVEVEIAERQDDDGAGAAPAGQFAAPIPVIVEALDVDGASIRKGDMLFPIDSLAAHGAWSHGLSLEITTFESPAVAGTLSLGVGLSAPFPLRSRIHIVRIGLPETVQASRPWLSGTLQLDASITGDLRTLQLQGALEWPDWLPLATFEGRIEQPTAGAAWSLEASVADLAIPDEALGEWAGAAAANGKPALHALKISASGTGTDLEISGETELLSPWTQAASVEFDGSVTEGRLSEWSLRGSADVEAEGWPTGQVDFTAGGAGDRISGSMSAPELFGGSLSVTAEIAEGEGRPWQAELTARNISTPALADVLLPHLAPKPQASLEEVAQALQSETLSARVLGSGRLEPLEISAQIERLEGRIRGRKVIAHGQLALDKTHLSATGLTLESGVSRLVLDGNLEASAGLELQVDIASLDDILPGSAGSLRGRIHYTGEQGGGLKAARLRADLKGRDLRAFDWGVDELDLGGYETDGEAVRLAAEAEISADAPLALSIEARGVSGPAGSLPAVSAFLAGDLEHQALTVTTELAGVHLATSLAGDMVEGPQQSWQGRLDTLILVPDGHPAWRLSAPAPLRIGQSISLESACLTPGEGELCFDFEHRQDGSQQGRMELAAVPLDLFAHLADWPLGFSQQLDGGIEWALQPGSKPSAMAEVTISAGSIVDSLDEQELLGTGEGVFSFRLDRGRLYSGDLDIPLDTGHIDIDFDLPDVLAGESGEIRGRIRVALDDLDPIANFVPELVQTDGALKADLTVSGTAGSPAFGGVVELHGGRTQVLSPGLRLSEIELTGRLEGGNRVRVDGTFLAGEGRGRLEADVDLSDPLQPAADIRLQGESLTLIDVPDMLLKADTDLKADWRDKELNLSGRIHVPSARFSPRFVPNETAVVSPDVVIVAGGEDLVQAPPEVQRNVKIHGEVDVSLGDDVVIDLELARATMSGQAKFKWNGPQMPIASGQYDLEGEVQAYGQTLETTRAAVRYPDVPANNPHLEVRAERRIYGNSMISRAGVLVHGTLRHPLTEAYTVPMTNADRARALLITGSDFDYEQGTGAVNVGTYISPRLYLGYGVGLFEPGNVVTVRYDLKRNFGVKATSGQNDTGLDISYTIER